MFKSHNSHLSNHNYCSMTIIIIIIYRKARGLSGLFLCLAFLKSKVNIIIALDHCIILSSIIYMYIII